MSNSPATSGMDDLPCWTSPPSRLLSRPPRPPPIPPRPPPVPEALPAEALCPASGALSAPPPPKRPPNSSPRPPVLRGPVPNPPAWSRPPLVLSLPASAPLAAPPHGLAGRRRCDPRSSGRRSGRWSRVGPCSPTGFRCGHAGGLRRGRLLRLPIRCSKDRRTVPAGPCGPRPSPCRGRCPTGPQAPQVGSGQGSLLTAIRY